MAGRKDLGSEVLLGRVKAMEEAFEQVEAQEAMDDSWPEEQCHHDDIGLEDLVQFFGAEAMGVV